MSPELPGYAERDPSQERIVNLCRMINDALMLAVQVRLSPDDERLKSDLYKVSTSLVQDSFSFKYPFRLVIPEDANARISEHHTNYIDEHPRVFLADHVAAIDLEKADFYHSNNTLRYLTSFDYNLRAEPI